MTDTVESADQREKEMTVGMSFTAPLSLAQWLQEYMRRKKVGRSEAVMAGLELLRREQAEQGLEDAAA